MFGRVRQTILALFAWSRPADDMLAADHLPPALFTLYQRMSRSDRQHHLRVFKTLLHRNHHHPALLQAALLHDVGKTRVRFTIIDRIIAVLVKKLLPRHFKKWSQGEPRGWRKALIASAHHPAWGAEMVATAAGDELVVELIRHHQSPVSAEMEPTFKTLLLQLQAADDAS